MCSPVNGRGKSKTCNQKGRHPGDWSSLTYSCGERMRRPINKVHNQPIGCAFVAVNNNCFTNWPVIKQWTFQLKQYLVTTVKYVPLIYNHTIIICTVGLRKVPSIKSFTHIGVQKPNKKIIKTRPDFANIVHFFNQILCVNMVKMPTEITRNRKFGFVSKNWDTMWTYCIDKQKTS